MMKLLHLDSGFGGMVTKDYVFLTSNTFSWFSVPASDISLIKQIFFLKNHLNTDLMLLFTMDCFSTNGLKILQYGTQLSKAVDRH